MARRKEKLPVDLGQAFQERCEREVRKLKQSLAKQLHQDLARLFDEGLHADLTLKVDFCDIPVHRFVLKARSRKIFARLEEICEQDGDVWTAPSWLSKDLLSSILRQLYGVSSEECETSDMEITMDQSTELYLLSLLQQPREPSCDTDEPVRNGNSSPDAQNRSENLTLETKSSETNASIVEENVSEIKSSGNGDVPCQHKEVTEEVNSASHSTDTDQPHDVQTVEEGRTENGRGDLNLENSNIDPETSVDPSEPDKGEDVSLPDLIKMTYDITVPYDTCSQLGEDLLRGFLQDLNYDCVVQVSGVHFNTHKCILSARSSYFDAMLSGSWMESENQEISLEGVTPGAIEQTLLYLYGGVTGVNPECSIEELVMVADMYGIEGLKEVVYFHMKKAFCHFFHKPCTECESRVPEALSYAAMYNIEELRDRCVKWINSHKVKVWRTKSFANLHGDVMDLCLNTAIAEMNISNVLETMLDCQKMNRTIPRLKWCEPVLHSVTTLMDKAVEYTSKHFYQLLSSPKFMEIDKSLAHKMGLLEELLEVAIDSLPIDGACQVFNILSRHLATSKLPEDATIWSQEFCEFVQSLYSKSEDFLKRHINLVVRSGDWNKLPQSTQTHLLNSANFVCIENLEKKRMLPPKLSSMQKKTENNSQLRKTETALPSAEGRVQKMEQRKGPDQRNGQGQIYRRRANSGKRGPNFTTDQKLLASTESLSSLPESTRSDISQREEFPPADVENMREILESFTPPEPVHCTVELLPILKWNYFEPK